MYLYLLISLHYLTFFNVKIIFMNIKWIYFNRFVFDKQMQKK